MAGITAITGNAGDGARAVGVSVVDHHGGALLANGILAGLLKRYLSGEGCRVEVSLLSAALHIQTESLVAYLNGPRPRSVRQEGAVAGWFMQAPYGIYPAKDGHIAISVCTLVDLAKALDCPELALIREDENFSRKKEISDLVSRQTPRFSVADLQERFAANNIWNAPVNDYEALLEDPQVQHVNPIVDVKTEAGASLRLVAHPVRFNGKAPEVRLPPQRLGAQTREILSELGLAPSAIDDLAREGIVGLADQDAACGSFDEECEAEVKIK